MALAYELDSVKNIYPLLAKSKYAYLNKDDIRPAINSSIQLSTLKAEINLVEQNISRAIPSISKGDLQSILPILPSDTAIVPLSQIRLNHQLKDSLSIDRLQARLKSEHAALVDLYLGNNELFTVIITENSFKVIKTGTSKDFGKEIWKIRKNQRYTPTQFASISNKFYKMMLDSAISILPKSIKRLVICSDGLLQSVPWDALVVDTLNTNSFKKLNYLVNHYTIRTVLTPSHLLKEDITGKGFHGLASDFKNSKKFAQLPFSFSLVKQKAIENKGTVNTQYKSDSTQFKIIHLATHVVNDSLHPYNSRIYFSDSDSLTISTLSNSTLRTKMAILNGCQTGRGIHYSSEGTISFARTFYTLGAQSVLMTLWDVDDKITADILSRFYDEIEDGNELDESLRQAKLDFIQHAPSDELANPYYWAGLQLSGKADPIVEMNYTKAIIISLIILASIFVGFKILRSKSS